MPPARPPCSRRCAGGPAPRRPPRPESRRRRLPRPVPAARTPATRRSAPRRPRAVATGDPSPRPFRDRAGPAAQRRRGRGLTRRGRTAGFGPPPPWRCERGTTDPPPAGRPVEARPGRPTGTSSTAAAVATPKAPACGSAITSRRRAWSSGGSKPSALSIRPSKWSRPVRPRSATTTRAAATGLVQTRLATHQMPPSANPRPAPTSGKPVQGGAVRGAGAPERGEEGECGPHVSLPRPGGRGQERPVARPGRRRPATPRRRRPPRPG